MITCKLCNYKTEKSLQAHLNKFHGLKKAQYIAMYPDSPVLSKTFYQELTEKNKEMAKDPAWKEKVSEGLKELWKDQNFATKMIDTLQRSKSTPQIKEKMKKSSNEYWANISDEKREERRQLLIKSWQDATKRESRINALKQAHKSEEVRASHSRATKKYLNSLTDQQQQEKRNKLKETWAQPENRKKILEISRMGLKAANSPEGRANQYAAFAKNPLGQWKSCLNVMMEEALKKEGLNFQAETRIGRSIVDFFFKDIKLIIETDGDYWHANPNIYSDRAKLNNTQLKKVKRDAEEALYCDKNGYTLLRFWETDLKKDLKACVDKIKKVITFKKAEIACQ